MNHYEDFAIKLADLKRQIDAAFADTESKLRAACRPRRDLVYVLAGTYEQARAFIHGAGVDSARWVYVDREDRLRGLRGGRLYVVGTARERPDYWDICRMADSRAMNRLEVN